MTITHFLSFLELIFETTMTFVSCNLITIHSVAVQFSLSSNGHKTSILHLYRITFEVVWSRNSFVHKFVIYHRALVSRIASLSRSSVIDYWSLFLL